MSESFFGNVLAEMPGILTRKDIKAFFGSFISSGYLANLDSLNKGPDRCRVGNKVVYRKEDFVSWLESRIRVRKGGQ